MVQQPEWKERALYWEARYNELCSFILEIFEMRRQECEDVSNSLEKQQITLRLNWAHKDFYDWARKNCPQCFPPNITAPVTDAANAGICQEWTWKLDDRAKAMLWVWRN